MLLKQHPKTDLRNREGQTAIDCIDSVKIQEIFNEFMPKNTPQKCVPSSSRPHYNQRTVIQGQIQRNSRHDHIQSMLLKLSQAKKAQKPAQKTSDRARMATSQRNLNQFRLNLLQKKPKRAT